MTTDDKPEPLSLCLTVKQAASMLGVSKAAAYQAVQRGEIPHLKIGRRVVIPRAAFDRYLALAGGAA